MNTPNHSTGYRREDAPSETEIYRRAAELRAERKPTQHGGYNRDKWDEAPGIRVCRVRFERKHI